MPVITTRSEQTVDIPRSTDAVVALANGGYLIATRDWDNHYAQRFDSAGNAVGAPITLSTQIKPEFTIVALTGGDFVMLYTNEVQQPGALFPAEAIYGQRFSADGVPQGGEFFVAAPIFDAVNISAAGTSDGGFIVTWNTFAGVGPDTQRDAVDGQRMSATGTRLGGPFQINTEPEGEQENPSVAAFESGGFVVVWVDFPDPFGADPDGPIAIRGQRFDASGVKVGTEFIVTPDSLNATGPVVTALDGGGFVVEWAGDARLYNASGSPLTNLTFAGADVQVTAVNGGGFLVIRSGYDEATLTPDILVQLYSSTGARVGGEFRVNDFVWREQLFPHVATLTDGRVAVSWTSADGELYTQILDPLGNGIDGSDAGDTLNGTPVGSADPHDVIYAYDGDDTVNARDGNDLVVAGRGNDTVDGGEGTDELNGGAGNDTLRGGAGNDELIGEAGNDILEGGDGDDILNGGAGSDDFFGGAGFDIVSYRNAFAGFITGSMQINLMTGGGGEDGDSFDSIEGVIGSDTAGDYIVGNAIDNYLEGDELTGLAGNDRLIGSADEIYNRINYHLDTVYGGTSGVTVNLLTGTATDGFGDTDSLFSIEHVLATNYDDHITGNDSRNTINTGSGNNTVYALGGDDEILLGSGNDYIEAGAGNDTIDSFGGTDTAYGGAGDDTFNLGAFGGDTMHGGSGNDVYQFVLADDVIVENANEGTDTIETGIQSYTLGANVENLLLGFGSLNGGPGATGTGNNLDNFIRGGTADDLLLGLGGNDTLNGGWGADTMRGHAGNDTYYVDNAGDIVDESVAGSGGVDTVRSGSFSINLSTMLGAVENAVLDTWSFANLTGNALNNYLQGSQRNNIIDGGGGADNMIGLGGNDTYYVDNAGDIVNESLGGGGNDIVRSANLSINLVDTTHFLGSMEAAVVSGSANLNLTGNALNNYLQGNSGNNAIDGGAGADTMIGLAGNDTYYIDNAGDVVNESLGGGGNDTVRSANLTINLADATHFLGSIEGAVASGSANLNLTGNTLNNYLQGNAGNNVIDGGSGADTMIGLGGNDTYYVGNAADVVNESLGGGGNDTVRSSNLSIDLADASHFLGNIEAAILSGSTTLNLTGNALTNYLQGNNGANVINGGAGADTLVGLGGADQFHFTSALGSVDSISDFTVGVDRFGLDNAVFTTLGAAENVALSAAAFRIGTGAGDASDRVIYNSATGAVLYDNDGTGSSAAVQFAQISTGVITLSASDFLII